MDNMSRTSFDHRSKTKAHIVLLLNICRDFTFGHNILISIKIRFQSLPLTQGNFCRLITYWPARIARQGNFNC